MLSGIVAHRDPLSEINSGRDNPFEGPLPKGKDLKTKRTSIRNAVAFWNRRFNTRLRLTRSELLLIHRLTKHGIPHNGVIIGLIMSQTR